MIRVALFLIFVGALALGVAWFADRPGDIAITWLGYRIETSLMVALAALAAVVVVAIVLWSLLRFLLRSPEQVSLFIRNRRAMKGHNAISRGLIAIGSGDAHKARRAAAEAHRLAPNDSLTLLLTAQAAQLAGDAPDAERAFRTMTQRDDTRLLGLRGLFIEAQRRGDGETAQRVAEEAVQTSSGVHWASQAVLDARCAAQDWAGALAALERMKGDLDKADYRRQRAVLLTARAQTLAETDRDTSRDLAREAVKLAPALVPAAVLAGRQLAEAGERRKASRMLETAWRVHPHPDLADAYADARLGASARERLERVQALAAKTPAEIEGALAVARAAIDARDFTLARRALEPYVAAPTQRVAALMADIEDRDGGDAGRARQWLARAMTARPDPVWTADGVISDRWLPVSPVTGKLDAFQWKVPLEEIGGRPGPVIEMAPGAAPAELVPLPPAIDDEPSEPDPDEGQPASSLPASPIQGSPIPASPLAAELAAASAPAPKPSEIPAAAPGQPVPEAREPSKPDVAKPDPAKSAAPVVIPLVHAPDDPGIGGTGVEDNPEGLAAPAASGWSGNGRRPD